MSDVGETLRNARQRHHWTLEDVAERTRIKATFLDALENEEYSLLPGPAYITGFLRNYARAVGLHPEEVVQEYYASRPLPQPTVKAATRVLAGGHDRHNRKRVLWGLGAVIALLVAGYAVRQYADNNYAHAYSPTINVTPANLGGSVGHPRKNQRHTIFHVGLRAVAPVWVRVTVDGARRFEGILRPANHGAAWTARHTIYIVTYDGKNIRAVYNGRKHGLVAPGPGLTVKLVTASGWRNAA